MTDKTFTQEQIAEFQAKAASCTFTRADITCWHFWFGDDDGDMTVEPCIPRQWQTILSYGEAKQKAVKYLRGKIEVFQGVLQRIENDTEDACAERWLRRTNHKEELRPFQNIDYITIKNQTFEVAEFKSYPGPNLLKEKENRGGEQ